MESKFHEKTTPLPDESSRGARKIVIISKNLDGLRIKAFAFKKSSKVYFKFL